MNLTDALSERKSQAGIEQLAREVALQPSKLAELWDMVEATRGRSSEQAAWCWYKIAKEAPGLLIPYTGRMLRRMDSDACSETTLRNLLGALQYLDIEEPDREPALDLGFRLLEDSAQPVAIRALAMGVLGNLVPAYPELIPELILILENLLTHPQAASIRARARNVLRGLKKFYASRDL